MGPHDTPIFLITDMTFKRRSLSFQECHTIFVTPCVHPGSPKSNLGKIGV